VLYNDAAEIRAEISGLVPFYPLARLPAGFLRRLVRTVVNAGRWVQTRSA